MNNFTDERIDCLIRMAYMECVSKDAELFDSIDTEGVAVPKRLNRKVHRLIARNGKKPIGGWKIAGRIAIAAMFIMSLMFATLISVTGTRKAIWRTIVSWYDDYITVSYEVPTTSNETAESTEEESDDAETTESDTSASSGDSVKGDTPTASAVIPPTYIEEVRKPTYVPNGTWEDIIKFNLYITVDYYREEDLIVSYNQYVLSHDQRYFDSENAIIEEVDINGYTATLVTHNNSPDISIIWSDGEYIYVIFTSALNSDEIIRMARSVQ